jgi:uncharacterized protein (TIGR00369 family)
VKILQELRDQGRGRDIQAVIDRIPYASFLGLQIEHHDDKVMTVVPFQHHLIGNVNLPAMHGGAVGAILEITAVLQLIYDTECERLPKTIDVSFDYLRSVTDSTTYGMATVTRRGRRVANVRTELWQEAGKPVAVSHGHFLLSPLD